MAQITRCDHCGRETDADRLITVTPPAGWLSVREHGTGKTWELCGLACAADFGQAEGARRRAAAAAVDQAAPARVSER